MCVQNAQNEYILLNALINITIWDYYRMQHLECATQIETKSNAKNETNETLQNHINGDLAINFHKLFILTNC